MRKKEIFWDSEEFISLITMFTQILSRDADGKKGATIHSGHDSIEISMTCFYF